MRDPVIYATRSRKGVEKFKEVEKAAFPKQEQHRAAAEERALVKKTHQPSLLAELEDQPASPRAVMLRQCYLKAARNRIEDVRARRVEMPFDEIWDTALGFPLVWDSDVKLWIKEWKSAGKIEVMNLKPRQRVPQWGQGHVVRFIS
jgi:hypothetical protein